MQRFRCKREHALAQTTALELRRGTPGYGAGYKCDACGSYWPPNAANERVAHCAHCKYDVCPRCVRNMLGRRCNDGHALAPLTVGFMAVKCSGYAVGFTCNVCHTLCRAEGSVLQDVVLHCSSCSYDLCQVCQEALLGVSVAAAVPEHEASAPRCARGHPLQRLNVRALHAENPDYLRGYVCDHCHRRVTQWTDTECVMHCPLCSFDLCSWCCLVSEARPQPAPKPSVPPTSIPSGEVECIVCMAAQRRVLFQPCGHFVCCEVCAQQLQACPTCRAAIRERLTVYM
eukprot:TRINITY_DN18914_c0_g1_i1.p1 TRINITY_DN18914_c0_g1~~TRINITY_DN18914_c0_g1_i1.p1  ORF type:complete len:286 (+),score=68.25 TRINITY_DN18914_c0_g1_i1:154-1011(+)